MNCRVALSKTKLAAIKYVVSFKEVGEPVCNNFFEVFWEATKQRDWSIIIHWAFVLRFKNWDNFSNFKLRGGNTMDKGLWYDMLQGIYYRRCDLFKKNMDKLLKSRLFFGWSCRTASKISFQAHGVSEKLNIGPFSSVDSGTGSSAGFISLTISEGILENKS